MVAPGEAVGSEEELARPSRPAPADEVVIMADRDDEARDPSVRA
jgi:hypothetical protein